MYTTRSDDGFKKPTLPSRDVTSISQQDQLMQPDWTCSDPTSIYFREIRSNSHSTLSPQDNSMICWTLPSHPPWHRPEEQIDSLISELFTLQIIDTSSRPPNPRWPMGSKTRAELLTEIFNDVFEDLLPRCGTSMLDLKFYNREYRPLLDQFTLCARDACDRRAIIASFWNVCGRQRNLLLERRNNLIGTPWAFPRPENAKFIRTLCIIVQDQDKHEPDCNRAMRQQSPWNSKFIPQQGDYDFFMNFLQGKYGTYPNLGRIAVKVRPVGRWMDYLEARNGLAELEELKMEIREWIQPIESMDMSDAFPSLSQLEVQGIPWDTQAWRATIDKKNPIPVSYQRLVWRKKPDGLAHSFVCDGIERLDALGFGLYTCVVLRRVHYDYTIYEE